MQGGIKVGTKRQCKNKKNLYNTKGGFNMFTTLKKRIKNEKGLSLVELLAVIVILAIIAAIAIPAIGNIIKNTEYKAVKSDALSVINAASIYFADQTDPTKTTVTIEALKTAGYLDDAGEFEQTGVAAAGTLNKTSPITLTTTKAIDVSGKAVTFTNATTDGITADNTAWKEIPNTGITINK